MASHTSPKEITICEAPLSSIPSLETIVPRAFHPTNEFHRRVFPDTPANRAWWARAFIDEHESPSCHLLTALDSNASDSSVSAVGLLCLRFLASEEPTRGFWDLYPISPDHDAELFAKAMDSMKLLPGQGTDRYLLELFGVDHAYKGTGIGRKLLEKACEIADDKGTNICVEANHMALKFYEKFGFVEEQEANKMPGMEYFLHLLVRKPQRKHK